MNCDICGRESFLVKALVEETTMSVCKNCSAFGKVIKEDKPKEKPKPQIPREETIEVIVPDYAEKIKSEREKLGLTQKDFARLISEKESLVHSIESKHAEPSVKLARKFERFFKIKLVEEHREQPKNMKIDFKSNSLTIGDLLGLKKK